jgi:hypothetical protein
MKMEKEQGQSMGEKKYGWKGWKMPLLHSSDPDYCEFGCPICTSARKGNRVTKFLQTTEMAFTFGGCWWGRARQRKYGVKPNEPLPSDNK